MLWSLYYHYFSWKCNVHRLKCSKVFLLLNRRPLRFHRNTLDLKLDTFRANQKLLTRAEKNLTPERTVDDNNNSAKPNWHISQSEMATPNKMAAEPYTNYKQISNSISDYGVVYFRSDSSDLLLKRASTYSDHSYTFDNPAFITSSNDELFTKVMLAPTNDRLKPYRPNSSNYAKISRSLDSIQDFSHDSAVITGSATTLPGAVMSQSDETVNETCTVRNIVLDERSQAWDTVWADGEDEDDDVTLPDTQIPAVTHNLPVS